MSEDRKIYQDGRCIGTLKGAPDTPQVLNKTQRMALGLKAVPTPGKHKYLTLVTEERDGEKVAYLYVSRFHPDEPCECDDPEYTGDDVHDDLRMTFKLDLIRLDDMAGLIG